MILVFLAPKRNLCKSKELKRVQRFKKYSEEMLSVLKRPYM